MPAHEARPPVPSDDDAPGSGREVEVSEAGTDGSRADPQPGGAAGALGWVRQHARGLVAGVIVAIAAFAAFSGPGSGNGGGDGDGGGSGATTTVASSDSTSAADPGSDGGSGDPSSV